MTLALYRKYRPRTFAEIIGQEHVTEPLSQALRSGRLNHAYLFSGPRGCGKTSSARILARSLNCEHGPTPEPCGTCGSCRSLAGDGAGSIDVIEIDAASHGGVDDARELREKAFFAPANSRFKIYVIDEAHMVSSAGFNALLKLVEEPPEYVKFIFATTEPEKVLGTIKSRTHHYPFRLIPPKTLRPYLEQLTRAEGVQVEQAVFPLVVRAGGGSARDSLSVLDQLIAGAGPEGVTYARAAALLGVTDAALIDEMCDALAAGDGAAAYGTVDRVAEAGHDPRRFAADLLERMRDLIVLQQVPDAAAKGLVDGPADQIERMAAQAQRLGPGTLSRCADIVHDGLVEMRGTTAPRLLLELICARMLLPGADDSTGGLLQRLESMERRLTHAGTDAPSPADQPPAVRAQPPAPPAAAAAIQVDTAGTPAATAAVVEAAPSLASTTADAAAATPPAGPRVDPSAVMPDPATPAPPRPGADAPGALDAVAVRRAWPEVVGKVNRSNKRIAALMRDAVVRDLDGDVLVLTVKSSVLAKMMADHSAVLTDALYEELGGRWQIRCEVAGEKGGVSLAGPRSGTPAGPARPATPAPATSAPPAVATPAPATPAPPAAPVASAAPAGIASTPPATPPMPPYPPSGGPGVPGRLGGPGVAAEAVSGAGGPVAVAVDDEEWPEAARPGGPATTPTDEDGDWPEAARPGGAATSGASAGPTVEPASHGSAAPPTPAGQAGAARSAAPAQPSAAPAGNGASPLVSSAIAAARAAAAGRGGPRNAQPARKTADADWAGEPPYDPDFDGPVRGGGGRPGGQAAAPVYEGFDPGDEPLDEIIDERTARQSSEEQAVQLLREALGAERINEVDAR